MKIRLIAVGTRMPSWVRAGITEYSKRLPQDFELIIIEIPLAPRGKSADLKKAIAREGEACLEAVGKGDYLVALDVAGQSFGTATLAAKVSGIRESGRNLALLVGGPDGLAAQCLERADACWSLSALTLPHPVVRVVVAEQFYRVWSFLNKHPYHRA
ncbi:MAG: 23S rRNA (pseudouridine(1915)-N(3))-methyltransferase RlmH [Pseudomonadales bacterium]|nr:23S rRNA (pseudouridine(1915)-N(3))-methyltransferase RlmH [Pseudomonadales bacterium]